MSGLAWTRLAASLPLVALAVGGLTAPALAGPTSAATPSATATAGPLANPSSPDVDPTTLVALTRPGVSDRQVKSQLKGGAGRLSASAAPSTAAARQSAGSVITVSTTAAGAAATIREMEGSGLYQAVDYQVKRTSLGYTSNPDDPYFQGPYGSKDGAWGLKAYPGAGFQQAWPGLATAEGGSATATVAVIDSGLQSNPDLVGSNVTSAYDYVDDDTDATVPNCARSTYQNPCDEDAFHGTAVAGLIGAATNNGLGVAGAAWDNDVIVYRVGEDGNLYGAAIDAAFQDAITRGVRVINCSYGGTSQDQVERILAEQAAQRGILVVAAAGNEAESGNPIEYPAGYDTVMGIAATAADGSQAVRSDFSNYGSDVAIAAPGENITLLGNGGYLVADGTSFATPMVAAAAALIWRMYPTLTLDQVESALTGGAHDLTSAPATTGWDKYTGWGQLDVPASLRLAAQEAQGAATPTAGDDTPTPTPTPASPSSPTSTPTLTPTSTPAPSSPTTSAPGPTPGGGSGSVPTAPAASPTAQAAAPPAAAAGSTLTAGRSRTGRAYVAVRPASGTSFNGTLTLIWGTRATDTRTVPIAGASARVALPYVKPGAYRVRVIYTDAATGRIVPLGVQAVKVAKYKPTVKVRATGSRVTVTVKAAGVASKRATGKVVVKLAGHKKTVRLVAREHGKVKLARAKLSVKAGTVKATYKGSAWLKPASGKAKAKSA